MSGTLTKIQGDASQLSAAQPPAAHTDLPKDDSLTLIIDNQHIQNWQSVSITRGIEAIPPVCELVLSFTDTKPSISVPPFAACQVFVGQNKILTGYVRRTTFNISKSTHQVHLSIGGKSQDLTECSAITADGKQIFFNATIKSIAEALCKVLGISVRLIGADGPVIPVYPIGLGMRPWDVFDEIARYSAKLIYEDEDGNLVISDIGSDHMGSGFVQGGNVLEASSQVDSSIRYSNYIAASMSTDVLSEAGAAGGTLLDSFKDDAVSRFRPFVSISPQSNQNGDLAIQMAKYEQARRIGRSQAVRVVVQEWRDKDGKLWEINNKVVMTLPAINVVLQQWLISEVTFIRDLRGQHAALVLMPPSAFTVAPSTLGAIDKDFAHAIQGGNQSGQSGGSPGQAGQGQPTQSTDQSSSTGPTNRVGLGGQPSLSGGDTSGQSTGGTRVYIPGLGNI